MTAEKLMLLGGIGAFVWTVWWVRWRHLREKYAMVWLLVATVALVCGLFPRLIMRFADESRLSYPSAVLFIALGAVYVFAFAVSVSLTRHYRRNVLLAQEVALLEDRVRLLEEMLANQGRNGPDTAGDVPRVPGD